MIPPDQLIESDYLTQFGLGLAQHLATCESQFGPLAIFARRLAWVPLNLPVRLDNGPVMDAGPLLTNTFEDAQVLIGCWLDATQFAALASLDHLSLCDMQLFEQGGTAFLGSVLFFETWLGQMAVRRADGRHLPRLTRPAGADLDRPLADLVNVESVLGGDSRTTLKDEALRGMKPIGLTSVSHGAPLSSFATEEEPVESLDDVLAEPDLVYVCHDHFSYGKPSALSNLATVSDAPENLSATWGTVFGFNDHWELTLCAAKGRNERAWRILKPAGRHFGSG